MLSVYFKCVARFFQWTRIKNKEFVSNFVSQMVFSVRNRWKCYRRHTKFLQEGQTVNKEYYLSVMKRLRERISRKRADLWKESPWILHHDNAPSQKTIIVNEFLATNSTNIIEQPPYSHDMVPVDFFLFPKLKLPLRGTCFQSKEAIKENSRWELKSIPENALKNVLIIELFVGISVLFREGPTLKAIK